MLRRGLQRSSLRFRGLLLGHLGGPQASKLSSRVGDRLIFTEIVKITSVFSHSEATRLLGGPPNSLQNRLWAPRAALYASEVLWTLPRGRKHPQSIGQSIQKVPTWRQKFNKKCPLGNENHSFSIHQAQLFLSIPTSLFTSAYPIVELFQKMICDQIMTYDI